MAEGKEKEEIFDEELEHQKNKEETKEYFKRAAEQKANQKASSQSKSEEEKSSDKKETTFEENEEKTLSKENIEIENLKIQLAKVLNAYKQLENDFENYKRRTKEDVEKAKDSGIRYAIETILPALDSFRKAKKVISDKSSINGINMIMKSMFEYLEKMDVRRIHCLNKPFNPELHNAVMLVEDKSVEPGTIVDEVEMGFTLHGNVIKYNKVVVAK